MISIAAITLGVVFSVVSAFEPHFSSAHRIHFDVLAANSLPYLLVGFIVVGAKPVVGTIISIAVVVTHLGSLLYAAAASATWGSLDPIYSVPLLITAVLGPVVYFATKPGWSKEEIA